MACRGGLVLSVAQAREQCPHEAYRARFSGIVGGVLCGVSAGWIAEYGDQALVSLAVICFILMFLAIAGARGVVRGRLVARGLATGAQAASAVVTLVIVLLGWDLQRAAAIAGAIGVLVACYALVLMFLPATNRYIHLVEVARWGEARQERGRN
jgi:hypothetical protein